MSAESQRFLRSASSPTFCPFDFNTVTFDDPGFLFCPFRPQYRAWLRSTFRPSPFHDQEQVGALLSQYTEQQESQRRGADQRWINQSVGALPSSPDDPEGSSWNVGLWSCPTPCVNGSSYYFVLILNQPQVVSDCKAFGHLLGWNAPLKAYVLYFYLHPSSYFEAMEVDLEFDSSPLPLLPMLL